MFNFLSFLTLYTFEKNDENTSPCRVYKDEAFFLKGHRENARGRSPLEHKILLRSHNLFLIMKYELKISVILPRVAMTIKSTMAAKWIEIRILH